MKPDFLRNCWRTAALASALGCALAFGAGKTDVIDAAARGDKAALTALIEQKADVNAADLDGTTALHWAAYRGDRAMVDQLIKAGANVKLANREGSTPLWLACINGDAQMIESLLKAGADANEKLPLGRTPLMVAARTGKTDAIKSLISHGANVNAKETLHGTTPIMWAADEGHAAAIAMLIEYGADIKARSNPAPRGKGPALGKSNDPRRQVAALAAALKAGQSTGSLESLVDRKLGGDNRQREGTRAVPAEQEDQDDQAGATLAAPRRRGEAVDGGQLTPLVYAVRSDDLASVKVLLDAGADINGTTGFGWSPLLVATQNRYYKLGAYLLGRGADPNLTNKGGWTPLYLATDNRNIESGDYPVRKGDMDHFDFIKLLVDKGANVNARMKESTETRTVFTNQWLDENGATAFLRASQSGDTKLMKYLLEHGADPKINTVLNVTPLQVAAGIGWVEGITYEWSEKETLEAVKMLLDLGLDPNIQSDTGRVALHGAAHKGRSDVVQLLVDHGARLDVRDYGNTDNRGSVQLAAHTWLPVDYADGLVRVGVQSAIPHPETGLLIRKLMTEHGLEAPPVGRTLESVCITEVCK